MSSELIGRAIGLLLVVVSFFAAVAEWTGAPPAVVAAQLGAAALIGLCAATVSFSRGVFALIGAAMAALALFTRGEGAEMIARALSTAAFIAAFFATLTTLRNASASAVSIQKAGKFLAEQPPGRRYAALTFGGQLFSLLLNYGSMALLGGMAEASARAEPDEEVRRHRIRRMLLAIQRGFVATLPWSPVAFATAISTALVPGARWADAVGSCLVSGAILTVLGWALDTIFKPKLSHPRPPRKEPEGGWISLWPLFLLLGVLMASVIVLGGLSGVRAPGVVMALTPALSLVWIALQNSEAPGRVAWARSREYALVELPGYRGEVLLLMMAGFIGVLGSELARPWLSGGALDFGATPGWVVLVAIVWLIPLTGQVGMNPILTVSLLAPLMPAPAALGLDPTDVIVAITAGWALGGASSPYTATTLLIGAFGGVSARHVGLRWNGLYTLLSGVALSFWVVLHAAW